MNFQKFQATVKGLKYCDTSKGCFDDHADSELPYYTYQECHLAIAYDASKPDPWLFSCRGAHGRGQTLEDAVNDEDAKYTAFCCSQGI